MGDLLKLVHLQQMSFQPVSRSLFPKTGPGASRRQVGVSLCAQHCLATPATHAHVPRVAGPALRRDGRTAQGNPQFILHLVPTCHHHAQLAMTSFLLSPLPPLGTTKHQAEPAPLSRGAHPEHVLTWGPGGCAWRWQHRQAGGSVCGKALSSERAEVRAPEHRPSTGKDTHTVPD